MFVKFFLLISAINYVSCTYVSEEDYTETEEIMEINEVKSNANKEEFDKVDRKSDNTYSRTSDDDESSELTITIPPQFQVSNCDDNENPNNDGLRRDAMVNYPYSASIQKRGSHYASGALINSQHVLTVAAEFYNVRETKKLFRVRLGSVDCKRNGLVVPIKSISIHPSFVPGRPSFDLGLLKLANPVETTRYIKPIQLSKVQQGVISALFLVTYWPRLIVNGKPIPKTANERNKFNNMRVSTQQLIQWKTCAESLMARDTILNNASLCLEPIKMHHSVCMPDVGAPVVADDNLWGVTSGWTSKHCSTRPSPTIVTRFSSKLVRDWLKDAVTDGAAARTEVL